MRAVAVGLAVLLACSLAGCAASDARPGIEQIPALAGEQFKLFSPETKPRYNLFVRLPEGYADASGKRYPIVYLLDGDSLFPLLAAQHLFMTIDDGTPEAIVVGIGYGSFAPEVNRRDRDYVEGSDGFHRFLKERLIPAVESRVRADPDRRILFGQSRGGRLVLRSAFADPDLFWGRIASNPSPEADGDLYDGPVGPHRRGNGVLIIVSGTKDRPANVAASKKWSPAESAMVTVRLSVEGGTHSADAGRNYREAIAFLAAQLGNPGNVVSLPPR